MGKGVSEVRRREQMGVSVVSDRLGEGRLCVEGRRDRGKLIAGPEPV